MIGVYLALSAKPIARWRSGVFDRSRSAGRCPIPCRTGVRCDNE